MIEKTFYCLAPLREDSETEIFDFNEELEITFHNGQFLDWQLIRDSYKLYFMDFTDCKKIYSKRMIKEYQKILNDQYPKLHCVIIECKTQFNLVGEKEE